MEQRPKHPQRPAPPSNLQNHPSTKEQNWKNMQKIKQYHDEAFLYIEQGLTCDEKGNTEQAVTLYSKGLKNMDMAYSISLDESQCDEQELQKTRNIFRKMESNRRQIQSRIDKLIQTDADVARSIVDPPPTYEEATSPTDSDFDMVLNEIMLSDEASSSDSHVASATELFKINDGVQIYFITKEGYVSAPSYPSSLGVYKFDESVVRTNRSGIELAQVFLKVGDWIYPLLAGRSPVLHANWGSYIFPDTTAGDGNAVGVILPDYISPLERSRFEEVMNEYTAMRDQDYSPSADENRRMANSVRPVVPSGECDDVHDLQQEPTSSKISRQLETAAEWISWGLMKGAEKTGELVKKGSAKLKQNIRPEQKASQIDPRAQKGLFYTRKATEGVVQVSGFLVSKLGQGTMYLARKAAPHLRNQGEKYLPSSMVQKNPSGQSKLDGALEVAAGGIRGWATVYVGLEQAAKVLAKNIADETVLVVSHKYGAEAGQVTEDTLYSGCNLALTMHHTSCMGATAVAKRVAKDTGVAMAVTDTTNVKRSRSEKTNGQANMDYGDKSTELRDH